MEEINSNAIGSGRLMPTAPGNRPKAEGAAPSKAFDAVLSKVSDPGIIDESTANGSASLQELSAPLPLIREQEQGMDLSSEIETTLDLVDQYARLLEDPSKDLKTVDSALAALTQKAQNLAEGTDPDSPVPQALGAIIDQVVLTATLERFKLDRGDYLDPLTGS